MTTAADGFLLLLKNEPTLMPPAPRDAGPLEHNRRLQIGVPCLHCGQRARCAFVYASEAGSRWLDLCSKCTLWVRTEGTPKWSLL